MMAIIFYIYRQTDPGYCELLELLEFLNNSLYVVPGSVTDGWAKMDEQGGVYILQKTEWQNHTNLNDTIYTHLKDIIAVKAHPENGPYFLRLISERAG